MKLHDERILSGSPERWLLVLHGIYGAGRNWASLARRLVEARPDWGVVLVDLRQHGASQGFEPPHTLEAAATDLDALLEPGSEAVAAGEARALLGHSFGGKVALTYLRRTRRPIDQLWLVDSTPDAGPPEGSAWEMLDVLRSLPGPFGDRTEAVRALEGRGLATPLAQWMATNLVGDEDGAYRWRIEAADMEALLLDFFRSDAWDVIESPPAASELHVVKAEASSVLTEQACQRMEGAGERTGRVHLHRVQGGHWVNADNPDALLSLLVARLPGERQR